MKALSRYMTAALRLIKDSGGVAVPEGGGWWKGADGKRLDIKEWPSCAHEVGTSTIYALADRGVLLPFPEDKHLPSWKQRYRINPAA